MSQRKQVFEFHKGETLHLDAIYHIQGLDKGDWWAFPKDEEGEENPDAEHAVRITRSIRITIISEDMK